MHRSALTLILLLAPLLCGPRPDCVTGSAHAADELLLAFASLRDRPLHPVIYFYRHDGRSSGEIVGRVEPVEKRSDHHPALRGDGQRCLFAAEIESGTSTIQCWDATAAAPVELAGLNETPRAQMAPAWAADHSVACFEAWNRPGSDGRWDLIFFDVQTQELITWPGVNTAQFDERKPSLSADGRWLAFTTNADSREQLTQLALFDHAALAQVPVPNLNSPYMDTEPSLSAEGRYLAFISDRPGGQGGRDVYFYDRDRSRLLPLPGLNSVGQEQSPAISGDGRYVAFVSERLSGAGERDIYLYDRHTSRLLPTPGLNSLRDEYDPCLIVVSLAAS